VYRIPDTGRIGEIIYSKIENIVLWARLEKLGWAVVIYRGMMENWNVGIMGLMEGGLFFMWMARNRK
jgi:hypothetical protein